LKNQKIAAFGSSYRDFCPSTILAVYPVDVGAAAGCDLLILLVNDKINRSSERSPSLLKNQNQKIAACGSSYRDFCPSTIFAMYPVDVGAAEGCDLLIFLPHREAERRFCVVGTAAWMPR